MSRAETLAIWIDNPIGWACRSNRIPASGTQIFRPAPDTPSWSLLLYRWLASVDIARMREVRVGHRFTTDRDYLTALGMLERRCQKAGVPVVRVPVAAMKRAASGPHATPRLMIRQARLKWKKSRRLTFPEACALWLLEADCAAE